MFFEGNFQYNKCKIGWGPCAPAQREVFRIMKKRNIIGAAVMAGLIALAMPLGAAHSLDKLREEARWEYYYDDAGYVIWEGIDKRQEAANNLLTVAARYVDKEPQLSAYIGELEYRVRASENTYSECSAKEVTTNLEMGMAAENLATALENVELSEKDKKYPAQLIAQMRSEQDKIQRSSYNDAARRFNDRLYSFPVNILRPFMDVDELAAFDEAAAVPGDGALAEQEATTTVEAVQEIDDDVPYVDEVEETTYTMDDRIESYVEGVAERIDTYVEQAVEGTADRIGDYVERKVDNAPDRAFSGS